MSESARTVVVYVHGLWLRGQEGVLLRRRLGAALDARAVRFTYPSVRSTLLQNAVALQGFLRGLCGGHGLSDGRDPHRPGVERVHLVAHSLGGLVVLKLFERAVGAGEPCEAGEARAASLAQQIDLPPGRIVLLGSPVQGCVSGHRMAGLPGGRTLLGRCGGEALLSTTARRWEGARELGVIAGTFALGAGRLLGALPAASDGTVLVSETQLPGARDHLTLPVNHSGLPFAASVAAQTASFLRDGRFQR